MTYTKFFNLERKPFELTANPDFLYLSQSHRKALLYLEYGIRERSAFVAITGDVGAGKTTLLRNMIRKYENSALICNICHTHLTSSELLGMIAAGFGVAAPSADKVRLLSELSNHLSAHLEQGRQPVLVIDEAQNLGVEALEEVRMLSNLENDAGKFMQIILVGQPELRRTLCLPEMLQLRQRIAVNCDLRPLSREEVEEYILHRLEKAGNRSAVDFDPRAVDIIFRYSRGIPRLINIICDFLMLAAFAEGKRLVDPAMVTDVAGELDVARNYWGEGEPRERRPPDKPEAAPQPMQPPVEVRQEAPAASAVAPVPDLVEQRRPGFFRRIFGIA
ncbi:MAG TPA: XrtA/PEP-CTERM system-associated ATPase [Verrucomicrobiae bacterium]|nr:XrtA/PEP-CTERM system-associated ATPase [Verrucomicrobiae bacterium]